MSTQSPRKGATVTLRFLDDEIMEGQAGVVDLDQPEIELDFPESSNNERALIPLPAIKRITIASARPSATERTRALTKVAIRFQDGEVLKGYLDGPLQRARHGLTMRLLNQERDQIDTLGVPYTAVKALFYLKSWDARPAEFDGVGDLHLTKRLASPLVDLVSDMGQLEKLRQRGAITESEFQRKRRKILDTI
ncbi:MAG TPA: SHOCT domain-containing protein [Candidatus Dormibacteraeota bacterium]|nr:SHOCT domain-containing protein [Candidatus Dormibacteraeota bacterium]